MEVDLSPRPLRGTVRDDRLFVGRAAQLETVAATLRRTGNVLLLGERGSGKTSLLHRVADLLRADRNVGFVDGRLARTAADVLALTRSEVLRWRDSRQDELELDIPSLEATTARTLIDELGALRAAVGERGSGVIVLDEAPTSEVARILFGRLRDELFELGLAWCVAADDGDRAAYLTPPADAFWARVVELPPLTAEEVDELLRRRGADVPAGVVAAASGGNPRRSLSVAQRWIEGGDAAVQQDVAERRRRAQAVSAPAQRLLAELEANGPGGPSDETLQARLDWSRGRLAQVFGELEAAGLVRSSEQRRDIGRPRKVFEVV